MIIRAKTENLIKTGELSALQQANTCQNILEMKQGKLELDSKPQRLVFEMTNSCNLNCVMCGRNAADFKPTFFKTEWLSLFDDVAKHVEEVTLMGWGEPTVHPDFVEFLKWANKHGLRKYFCTNGTKLDVLLTDIFEQEVDVIAISLDGATEQSNSSIRRGSDFNRIIESLKLIVREKKKRGTKFPYMNFVTTLMSKNIREFPKIVELAGQIGLDEAKGVYLTVFDENMVEQSLFNSVELVKEVFAEATEIADRFGIKIKLPHLRGEDSSGKDYHKPCYVAWRDFFLGSDGYVRPCMSTAEKLFSIEEYSSFEKMWNSKEFISFRKSVNDAELMNTSCKNCYQSSFANWNNNSAFFQLSTAFSPDWQ